MNSRKRVLIIILAVLIGIGVVSGGYVIWRRMERDNQAKLEVRETSLQENLQKPDGCSEANMNELASLYEARGQGSEDKALYAEQRGTCLSSQLKHTEAAEWYRKAQEAYRESGDDARVSDMELAIQNSDRLAGMKPFEEPQSDAEIDYNVGQN